MKDRVVQNLLDCSTLGNETIKVVYKTGKSNEDKDRIQLDVKKNTKETVENDDNNVDTETEVISNSINWHTNQNNNDSCDSDNELLLTCNMISIYANMTKITICKIKGNILSSLL